MNTFQTKLALVTVCLAVLLAAFGSRQVHAEKEAGAWLVISHKVYDYALWKREHERSAELKRTRYGWQRDEQYFVGGDRNHVMVMELFATRERAEAFAKSRELLYEMASSGVSSEPELRVVQAASTAR